MLPIAPASFYDHLAKRADPSRLSDRAKRDAELKPEIEREAAAFHERFVTLRILSRTRGESWQSLSSKLRDAGVAPFKPGDTDYGNIYLKYDVQSALPE